MTGRYKAYAEYKDSGVEWVGSIPTHWGLKKLKYLAPLIGEKATEKTNPIALEHIQSWTGKLISSDSTFEGDGTKFKAGDILFGKLRPYLAKVYLTKADGEAIGDFHVMRPISNSYGKFLKSLMLTKDYIATVDASTYGAKMPRASWDFTSNIQLPFCSEVEAEKIANFLDHETAKIDTLITKQEKLIELLKEKRQAVISHAVTKGLNPDAPMKDSGVEWLGEVPEHWKACPLKTISKFRQGKLHEPYIHEDGKFICVNSRFVSTEGEKFKYCSKNLSPVENEDILMVMSDLPNGRALAKALFVQGDNNFALNQRVCAITATEIDARFLYYQLNRNEYFLSFDDGCNQTNLSNYVFKNFPALVPYKAEQCEIAEYLDRQTESFDRLVEIANRQIELMKERKTALISAAVTGKIDVRDWEGEA
ncbi:TPA: restriction endonuclease subunit S [Vibrio parahaemolyticus]|nr:restriction endonuclease subunit S [Vibrio parahaemolyticus]